MNILKIVIEALVAIGILIGVFTALILISGMKLVKTATSKGTKKTVKSK